MIRSSASPGSVWKSGRHLFSSAIHPLATSRFELLGSFAIQSRTQKTGAPFRLREEGGNGVVDRALAWRWRAIRRIYREESSHAKTPTRLLVLAALCAAPESGSVDITIDARWIDMGYAEF